MIYEHSNLSAEVWRALGRDPSALDTDLLDRVTDTFAEFRLAGQLVGVAGVMPQGFVSDTATLWFGLPEGFSPGLYHLRLARSVFAEWRGRLPYTTLFAEVPLDSPVSLRWAEYLGFRSHRVFAGRQILMMENKL